ncbi:MAG TPA: lipoate--protein ligase family protein [Gemmatimonadaceae bacterium]
MPRQTWRLLVTPPANGAENMALDEALMDRARETGDWVLRIYSWSAPTISLGRNQSARGRYDLDRIQTLGLGVVRRPTGGRAILHDREITYSVTAPVGDAGDLHESYHRINRLLLHGLRSLGVAATVANPTTRSAAPTMAPCFNEPSAGELTLDGRKLAGSAQWRSADALLQHGSILVADDQSLLATLARDGQRGIPAPATLTDALGEAPELSDVAAALADAVRNLEDADATELVVDDELRARASALVVRYLDAEWTWRR